MARVGIFDSGLGGLTVLRALRETSPGADYIYLGDTARTPYGNKSKATIERYSMECARFLQRQEVDLLIVACNTASSLALAVLERECNCPVIGTIEPAIQACARAVSSGTIGVIGTRATILSCVYEAGLQAAAPALQVMSKACPLFVPLVEEGLFEGPLVDQVIREYLEEWRGIEMSALLLACTHYPLLSPALREFFGPEVEVLDCAAAIADRVVALYGTQTGNGSVRYFVSDEPSRFSYLSSLISGERVEAVHLEEL